MTKPAPRCPRDNSYLLYDFDEKHVPVLVCLMCSYRSDAEPMSLQEEEAVKLEKQFKQPRRRRPTTTTPTGSLRL